MVKIVNPLDYDFMKAECFGKPNTGKSTFAMSICRIKPKIPTKNKIVYFVNDPTYVKALKNFIDNIDMFDIRQHRMLTEFEADWDEFCDDYKYKTEYVGTKPVMNTDYIRDHVHAIVLDEGEQIYREGYVARHARSLNKKAIDLKPSDYGVPRSDFTIQVNRMAMLPCHFILCSKVGAEYKEDRYMRVDGTPGALQFKKTGEDTYRLPDNVLYMPNLSMHLFEHKVKKVSYFEDATHPGKQLQQPILDKFGKQTYDTSYHGRARKQKADREKDFTLRNPTMSKVMLKLAALQRKTDIQ